MGFRGSRAEPVAMTTQNLFRPGPSSAHTLWLSPAINLPPYHLLFLQSLSLWVNRSPNTLLFQLWNLSLPPFPLSFLPSHIPDTLFSFLFSLENMFTSWTANIKKKKFLFLWSQHGSHVYYPSWGIHSGGFEYSQEGFHYVLLFFF